MSPEWIYLLKANMGIALFYAFYKLFCCRDTLFQWRRVGLLVFLVVPFLYPVVDLQGWIQGQPSMNELAGHYAAWVQVEHMYPSVETSGHSAPNVLTYGFYLYIAGMLVLSVRFLIQLVSIFRMAWISERKMIDGCRVFSLPVATSPFSFFGWIFLYLPALNPDVRSEILKHEQTHVSQWHSLDVVFSELVCIFCWANPFVWLMKSEIRLNLEYLADRCAIEGMEDVKPYQYHLLGITNPGHPEGIHNHFNVSFLKHRIAMMNRRRSCRWAGVKYVMFIPLCMLLLLVSNVETVARTFSNDKLSVDDKDIYTICDTPPVFPGGESSLVHYLNTRVHVPVEAFEKGIEGRVLVRFVVDRDGNVKAPVILRSPHPWLSEEALRIVRTMPRWTPAAHLGETVACYFTLPVAFRIRPL